MSTSQTIWNVPNLLTLSRLPLSVCLFIAISERYWLVSLAIFTIASLTDWLDGWWARKFNQLTAFGRTFDPLIDKVMVGGAFIYLLMVPEARLLPWMVTVVIGRELLITGIRGYVEALGKKFGADWFGKLKMVLQCVVLFVIFTVMSLRELSWLPNQLELLESIQVVLIYAMLAATMGSGLQYCWRAAKLARPG
jgi:CDP-diacylglycerol--glycerol-3-phosphate 3-phosphatidyltransferase